MAFKTPLYKYHEEDGAKIVDFAGWLMPIQYESIATEHHAVRTGCGMFDVSHMGRFLLSGKGAVKTIHHLIVSRVEDLEPGMCRYSVICNPEGGMKDDIIVSRLASEYFLMVVNASNREKLIPWIKNHMLSDTHFADNTFETGMIAIQGPQSSSVVQEIYDIDLSEHDSFRCRILNGNMILSRTGYTGEDGFEIIGTKEQIADLWRACRQKKVKPAGLGARDSLRLEMGYSLYGHELSEEVSPIEAGLSWVIHWDKNDFIGKAPLLEQKNNGALIKRIGFELLEQGIPRQGCAIEYNGQVVGEATSGGYSLTLKKGIGLALVKSDTPSDADISVDIRGKKIPARIVKPPFLKKK